MENVEKEVSVAQIDEAKKQELECQQAKARQLKKELLADIRYKTTCLLVGNNSQVRECVGNKILMAELNQLEAFVWDLERMFGV